MLESVGHGMEAGFGLGAFNPVRYGAQLSDWLAQLLPLLLGPSTAEGPRCLARWRERSLPLVADLQLALLLAVLLPGVRWALECTAFDVSPRPG